MQHGIKKIIKVDSFNVIILGSPIPCIACVTWQNTSGNTLTDNICDTVYLYMMVDNFWDYYTISVLDDRQYLMLSHIMALNYTHIFPLGRYLF